MKRQIRRGVFESNSSSMHSLTVMKKDGKYTPEEILEEIYLHKDRETGEEHCVWEPWEHDMEFGRSPFRALGTFTNKWLYALASMVGEYNDETYKELERIAFEYIPGLKKIKLPTCRGSVINKDYKDNKDTSDEYVQKNGKTEEELLEFLGQKEKLWGMEINYWEGKDGWWGYDKPYTGYVDENVLSGFLKKENITLEEFLINKKYVVICDGDEYGYYGDMKKIGLIDLNAIDHEYPDHSLED